MAMKGGIVKPQTKLKSGINEKNKKEDGMKPVSYTHLDVYKRQILHQLGHKTGGG